MIIWNRFPMKYFAFWMTKEHDSNLEKDSNAGKSLKNSSLTWLFQGNDCMKQFLVGNWFTLKNNSKQRIVFIGEHIS